MLPRGMNRTIGGGLLGQCQRDHARPPIPVVGYMCPFNERSRIISRYVIFKNDRFRSVNNHL